MISVLCTGSFYLFPKFASFFHRSDASLPLQNNENVLQMDVFVLDCFITFSRSLQRGDYFRFRWHHRAHCILHCICRRANALQ